METYSLNELDEIRLLLNSRKDISDEEKLKLNESRLGENISNMLLPLYFISIKNKDLFEKIKKDPLVEKYSYLCFLPEIHERIYAGRNVSHSIISAPGHGNRGMVIKINDDSDSFVFKKEQSYNEKEIAKSASDLKIGPKLYDSLDGFILEEFVKGTSFSELVKNNSICETDCYNLGLRVGDILNDLMKKNIVYNDIILMDDFWYKSHLIVPQNIEETKLIDFGVSIDASSHPNLDKREVFKYFRTLPFVSYKVEQENLNEDSASLQQELYDLKKDLDSESRAELFRRDLGFIFEGCQFVAYRNGSVANAIFKGFRESYKGDLSGL